MSILRASDLALTSQPLDLGSSGLTLTWARGGQTPGTEARQIGACQPLIGPSPHSSSEWNNVDPYEREQLRIKMEDGEFW